MPESPYKNTLNLPKTEFPMRGNLAEAEPKILASWHQQDLYGRIQTARRGQPKFILHDGPPYANASIHYGHILNKVLKDFVVKHHTMKNQYSPFVPGWDCHGLPIELEVERELGEKRAGMSKLDLRKACHAHAQKFVEIQKREFARLGILADWDHAYLTLDKSYEAQVVRALAAFVRGGALYRGKKPVHWCPTDATALAEFEIEYKDHVSPSIYVRFPLTDFDPARLDKRLAKKSLSLVIWTTTPWTLPANLAIVLNPKFEYVALPAGRGNEYFLCARSLAESFADACALKSDPADAVAITPQALLALEGARYRHPFVDAPVEENDFKLWFADHVTLEQGTGLVHTAPGHGSDDYHVGVQKGLRILAPVDNRGRFTDEVPPFAGLGIREANPKIVEHLVRSGALLSDPKQSLAHSYPHCWRCKQPVIFRATPQWFLSLEHADLRRRALDEIKNTRWVPPWGENRITGMIENRPDWCLSRQRAWGVPIPAVHCTSCGQERIDGDLLDTVANIFEKEGADAWFARSAGELLPELVCQACGGRDFAKEEDIVDVWFESGVSWFAVCAPNPELGEPVDLYLEGSDQHRGWFHSSLLAALGVVGHAPYKTVLTHGHVLDENSNPYSKSAIAEANRQGKKTEFIPPADVIGQQGAELLRLWVASTEFRNDIPYSRTIVTQLGESYRKFRNTCRFLLGNLYDFSPEEHNLAGADLLDLDRYALAQLGDWVARAGRAYDDYQFHVVFRSLIDYVTVDLSAFYLDVVKDRLYCEDKNSQERRAAQTTIYAIGRALTKLAAPILCFTAEELWQHLPRRSGDPDSVHLAHLPQGQPMDPADPLVKRWTTLLWYRQLALKEIEAFRAQKHHPLEARVTVKPRAEDRTLLGHYRTKLADLFGVSSIVLADEHAEGAPVFDITRAPGTKCARCWKIENTVSDLCERCQRVVQPGNKT